MDRRNLSLQKVIYYARITSCNARPGVHLVLSVVECDASFSDE
jgi:hypothetical protein